MELELYTREDMNNYASWYIKNTGQYSDDGRALKEGLYLNDFNKTRTSNNIEDVINIEQLALEVYPIDNQETSKGCIDDMNLSDRGTWISGAKKILDFFKKPLSSLEIQSIGRQNRNSQPTPVITVTVEEPKQRIVILNPMSDNILVQDVNVMGMPLVRWSYKGCEVDFGIGEDFAFVSVAV